MSPYDVPVALALLALIIIWPAVVIWRATRKDKS